jgi:hypothetical protein
MPAIPDHVLSWPGTLRELRAGGKWYAAKADVGAGEVLGIGEISQPESR